MTSTAPLPTCSAQGSHHVSKSEIAARQHNQLIQQAQHGNLDAFNELIVIHQDSIFSQALWILNNDASAEEASQETFLVAFHKLQTFHGGSFRAWLLKITTAYCLDQIHAANRRDRQQLDLRYREEIESYSIQDPGNSSQPIVERPEIGDQILQCVRALALEYRLVVILMDLQRLDYAEASGVLDIPVGTLKSRLSRARIKLHRDLFKKSYPDRENNWRAIA